MKEMMNIVKMHEVLQNELEVFKDGITTEAGDSWKTRIEKEFPLGIIIDGTTLRDIHIILKNWNTQVENLLEILGLDQNLDPNGPWPEDTFLVGLHCTHTDADGLGGFLPDIIVDSTSYWNEEIPTTFTLVSACAEYKSSILILLNAMLFKLVFKENPARFFITDIALSFEAYQSLFLIYPNMRSVTTINPYKYFDLLEDEFDFVYVDHHASNPWLAEGNNALKVPGIFVAVTLKDFKRFNEIHYEQESNLKYLITRDQTKISATYIMGVLMRDIVTYSVFNAFPSGTYATTYTNQVLNRFYGLIRAISDWDTFEWRDHPAEEYDEFDPIDIGNLGFQKNPVFCFNDVIKHIWSQTDAGLRTLTFFPANLVEDMKTAKVVNKAVTSQCLGKGKWMSIPELPEIENWFVFGFPTIGNASIICHFINQSDEYKDQVGTKGIIMLDLYTDTVSFRTTETDQKCRVDVIAKRYNGGGHPQASGCRDKGLADLLKTKLLECSH